MSDDLIARPEALLKSALEKIVYFEARSQQLENDLTAVRSESDRLRIDVAQAAQREIELRRLLAELEVRATRAYAEREESVRVRRSAAPRARRADRQDVLIKIMVGLLKPDAGEVVVLGKHVDKLKVRELDALRLRVGFSFQSSALYDSMDVYQNLAFPLTMNKKNLRKAEVDHEVEEALDAVGLAQKIYEMPSDLSGGQRKRIGIARTLILKPEIILYDEPTSGLDPSPAVRSMI